MRCRGLRKDGRPCGFKVGRGQDLCLNHDPSLNPSLAAAHAAAAAVVARRARSEREPMEVLTAAMSFTDRTSIQATLDGAVRLYLSGRLGKEQYRELLRGCALAIRNFDRAGDTLAGPRPQAHEWDDYFDKVKSLLLTADPLLDLPDDPECGEVEGA